MIDFLLALAIRLLEIFARDTFTHKRTAEFKTQTKEEQEPVKAVLGLNSVSQEIQFTLPSVAWQHCCLHRIGALSSCQANLAIYSLGSVLAFIGAEGSASELMSVHCVYGGRKKALCAFLIFVHLFKVQP